MSQRVVGIHGHARTLFKNVHVGGAETSVGEGSKIEAAVKAVKEGRGQRRREERQEEKEQQREERLYGPLPGNNT